MTANNLLNAPDGHNRWLIVRAENGGLRAIYRIRTDLKKSLDRGAFPICVVIEWPYVASDNGMPGEFSQQQMSQLEEELESLAYGGEISLLMLVVTARGIREWVFYVRQFEPFLHELNQLMDSSIDRPISIFHDLDPEWNYWNHYSEKIERRIADGEGVVV